MKYELKNGWINITIDHEFNQKTINDFFVSYYISAKNKYCYLQSNTILLNGKTIKNPNIKLQQNDILNIKIIEQPLDYEPANNECIVVYEDDFVYVAHKPAGIIVHGKKDDYNSFACMAAAYQRNHNIPQPVRYIHRLDRDTTGLILCIKVPFFQPWFDTMLQQKKIHRHYYAIVFSKKNPPQKFKCTAKIGKDRHINGKFRISKTGKEAKTYFSVVKTIGPLICLHCRLNSGRTHQIRVHLSHMNLPIINDTLYGVTQQNFQKMGLWANQIKFENPLTHETLTATDIANDEFKQFIDYNLYNPS